MADENETENGAAAPQVKMQALAQYIRDLSFENVVAQKGSSSAEVQPDIQVGVNLDARQRPQANTYDVIAKFKITSTNKANNNKKARPAAANGAEADEDDEEEKEPHRPSPPPRPLPEEPAEGAPCVRIALRLSNGERVERRFAQVYFGIASLLARGSADVVQALLDVSSALGTLSGDAGKAKKARLLADAAAAAPSFPTPPSRAAFIASSAARWRASTMTVGLKCLP